MPGSTPRLCCLHGGGYCVRYEVTFFDEADSLLIVLHGIDDESLVYRLLMREGHFWVRRRSGAWPRSATS